MPTIEITRDLAVKIRDLIDLGLVKGVGNPVPGQMCIEALVCFAMGLPHGDEPTCVSPSLRSLKIQLNDKEWSSNTARAAGLRRLGLAQLGSADTLDEKEFLARVVEMTIGKIVPRAMRSAAKVNPKHAIKLEDAAKLCETKPTQKSANAAANAAAYAAAYAANAAANAAYAAAYAANAANAAAYAAYAANAAYAARSKIRDQELAFFAEEVVQILIAMKAPGCQWLDLAPLSQAAWKTDDAKKGKANGNR